MIDKLFHNFPTQNSNFSHKPTNSHYNTALPNLHVACLSYIANLIILALLLSPLVCYYLHVAVDCLLFCLHRDQVVQQRDELVDMLETERLKERREDEELQNIMTRKGFELSPVPYTQVTLKKGYKGRQSRRLLAQ